MKTRKIKSIDLSTNQFTSVLNNIDKPPKELFIQGIIPEHRPPVVAIVGTRKPSDYGKYVTHKLSYNLAKAGVYVISGLAFGVDALAHKAAIEAGGTTIAVLPTSLNKIYPASNEHLAKDILKSGGALISKHPSNTSVMKHHFLERNRIISGLADAVIVTEATERSGTFSTIRHAISQNKDIFAVPGPINSLSSVGPNQLIRQGAHVALSAQDILHLIAPNLIKNKSNNPVAMTTDEAIIIELLKQGFTNGEDLLRLSKIETSIFLQTMTMLEINSIIKPLGNNYWCLLA